MAGDRYRTADARLEVRATDDSHRGFSGYASVFGVVDSYGDVVARGAFARTLKERTPVMLWQHNPSAPIGIWEELHEDDHGLAVRGRLVDTAQGRDVYALLKMGAINGLSIGYRTRQSETNHITGHHTLTDVELFEISCVTFPANDGARVTGVRNAPVPLTLADQLDLLHASMTMRTALFARALEEMDARLEAMRQSDAAVEHEPVPLRLTPEGRAHVAAARMAHARLGYAV